ncbi:MAG: endonuclease [Nitrospiraceae bacterium]|nr:endonuclease [Nitrospiraceae bacterium]
MDLNPYWISGFVDGEGTFYVGIYKNSTMRIGFQVLPEFVIVQHKRDVELLNKIKNYFNCGVVRVNHDDRMEFRVRAISDLNYVIIPFFKKYPLRTKKKEDFKIFSEIVLMMVNKEHLTETGVRKILSLSKEMNRKNKVRTAGLLKELIG